MSSNASTSVSLNRLGMGEYETVPQTDRPFAVRLPKRATISPAGNSIPHALCGFPPARGPEDRRPGIRNPSGKFRAGADTGAPGCKWEPTERSRAHDALRAGRFVPRVNTQMGRTIWRCSIGPASKDGPRAPREPMRLPASTSGGRGRVGGRSQIASRSRRSPSAPGSNARGRGPRRRQSVAWRKQTRPRASDRRLCAPR